MRDPSSARSQEHSAALFRPDPHPFSLAAGWPRLTGPRIAATAALAILSIAGGAGSLLLEAHERRRALDGADLDAIRTAIATGSGPRTVWVGFAVALIVGFSVRRLRNDLPEPPARNRPTSAATARTALRREWQWGRRLLSVLLVIAALDAGRAVVRFGAVPWSETARMTAAWVTVEAAGLMLATRAQAAWCSGFRDQLRVLGALDGTDSDPAT